MLLGKNAEHWSAVATSLGASALGLFYEYNLNLYAPATIAPWQQNFVAQTYGHVSDLEPLADMTAWNRTRDFVYRVPVGLLGDGGSSAYCFARAPAYNITIGTGQLTSLSQAFTNWHDVDVATNGNGLGVCPNTLQGSSGGAPDAAAIGYWGNLLPAIAYARDRDAPGQQRPSADLRPHRIGRRSREAIGQTRPSGASCLANHNVKAGATCGTQRERSTVDCGHCAC